MSRRKPGRWGLSPGLVDPDWRWVWRGLIAAYPMWEGGGSSFYDIARKRAMALPASGVSWTTGPVGFGLNFADTANPTDASIDKSVPNRTWIIQFRLTSLPGSNAASLLLLTKSVAIGSATNEWTGLGIRSTGAVQYHEYDGTDRNLDSSGITVSAGNVYTVVAVGESGKSMRLFINGLKVGTLTITGSLYTGWTSGPFLRIGQKTSTGSPVYNQNLNGQVFLAGMWERALSDREAALLSATPFGPLRMVDEAGVIYPAAAAGDLTVTLDTLTLAGSIEDLSAVPGAVSLSMDTLTLAGSIEALTLQTLTTILLDTLNLAGAIQDLTVAPGAVSVTLDTLSLAGSVENLTLQTLTSIALDTLTLAGSVQGLTATPGAVSITLDTLTLAGSVEDLTIALGALSILLDTLSLSGSVQGLTVTAGAVSVTLDTLSLAGSVEDLTITLGALAIVLDTLLLALAAQDLTAVPGAVSTALDTLNLAGSVQDLSLTPGGVNVALDTLSLAASTEDLVLLSNAFITLDTLTLMSSVVALSALPGSVSVSLDTLTLAGSVQDLTVAIITAVASKKLAFVEFRDKRAFIKFRDKRGGG